MAKQLYEERMNGLKGRVRVTVERSYEIHKNKINNFKIQKAAYESARSEKYV